MNKIPNFAHIFYRFLNLFVNQNLIMTEGIKVLRISKLAKEFNIGRQTIVDFLAKKGIAVDPNPNTKISPEAYEILAKEFQKEKNLKEEVRKSGLTFSKRDAAASEAEEKKKAKETAEDKPLEKEEPEEEEEKDLFIKDMKSLMSDKTQTSAHKPEKDTASRGPKIVGKLPEDQLTGKKSTADKKTSQPPSSETKKEKQPVSPDETKQEAIQKEKEKQQEELKKQPEVKPQEAEKKEEIKTDEKTQDRKPEEEPKVDEKKKSAPGKISKEPVDDTAEPEKPKTEKSSEPEGKKPEKKEDSVEEKKTTPKEPVADQKEETTAGKALEEKKEEQVKTEKKPEEKTSSEEKAKQPSPPKEDEKPVKETAGKTPDEKKQLEKEQVTGKKEESSDKFIKTEVKKLEGVTILGKIELPAAKDKSRKQPVASSSDTDKTKRRKRKRIRKDKPQDNQQRGDAASRQKTEARKGAGGQDQKKQQHQNQKSDRSQAQQQQRQKKNFKKEAPAKQEVSDEEISRQIRETLASLSGTGKSKGAKHRRLKRDAQEKQRLKEAEQAEMDLKKIQVTEFVSANELASLMDVPVTEVISTCMNLGLFVSINQRLDAETITIVADEFGFEVEFISVDEQEVIEEDVDDPAELQERAPIVTVMGHVDHGKTSLLDQIRHANVIAGEAGGITQHIGAYSVQQENGKMITFLDTPGHEAFTAMRARGARVTDVVIVVVAADDNVMPQTVEAINHAQAAGVPIVIAINKIDKPTANVERVKEELANINILVEDWGGKYQSQEISAKNGVNIDHLLEKVLLESELLDLKANPNKPASGTVIESSLDKGRGYLATILVQNGHLKVGDIVVAGNTHGRVKAMFNERNQRINEAGPSTPALLLGLDGAPQAGDNFNVMKDEQEAKAITSKRQQLIREQGLRTQKHITLDEIGRRIAIGDFKELNIIVKGDVDGSVEALADSMLKLSTEEVQVNIIHKAVGSITEGDVLLASASNAVIVGFQVRPSMAARKLAENEEIDIRLYSVIYNAINEIKSAIEGMLSPEIEEKIVANLEIREVFKISKVGSVAGCMVLDGKIHRNSNIRVIRDGIVVYTGYLGSLKRFKEDVKEVSSGYECGLNVDRFNDIKKGDIIEAFETVEVARKLD